MYWNRKTITSFLISVGTLASPILPLLFGDTPPDGDAVIRNKSGASEIVITTTNRLAGAIHSLTWNGKEFIDSFDHGRQLQSAASFDLRSADPYWAERYNPTEAGSRSDGKGPTSTSQLISIRAKGAALQTTTRMAFWLAPGQNSSGRLALNNKPLSDHLISKRVSIGYQNLDNVIEYQTTFTVPKSEKHHYAQFEALTGYMPAEFDTFWTFNPETGKLQALSDGPGEQNFPVVLSTKNGRYAMGIFSPDQPSKGYEHAGYGRFRFKAARVVKWNCAFRVRDKQGIKPGDYTFRIFVAIGTREDVRNALASLVKEF